jgi:crossover junction endodeoxyribonuclease RusA
MVLISREARAYKNLIRRFALIWKKPKLTGRLSIHIQAFPPDKRARDLDNLIKITCDALQDAGLFENDSQIDKIFIERKEQAKGGKLLVSISEIG